MGVENYLCFTYTYLDFSFSFPKHVLRNLFSQSSNEIHDRMRIS